MTVNYVEFLKGVELFSKLGPNSLKKLSSSVTLKELPQNETLFCQGDKPDSLYILLSGYLIATLENENGHVNIIGQIRTSEIIGEMGLLTKKPRLLTIKALTNSKLLELSEENFMRFIKSNPDVLYKLLISTISRNQNTVNIPIPLQNALFAF